MVAGSRTGLRAQILQRRGVDVPVRLDLRAAIADIRRLGTQRPGSSRCRPTCQRCIRGDFGLGSKNVMVCPRNVSMPSAEPDRLLDAALERVRQGLEERQAVVERRHQVRRRS